MKTVVLGKKINIEDIVNIARYGYKVEFSREYIDRVIKCRECVEKFLNEERIIYGITTGLGDNCIKSISKEDSDLLQRNIILSHATSVGEPLNKECVRAIMGTMLQHMGSGYTGIKIETLELIKDMLNNNVTPYVPSHGSVGYLGIEGHISLVIIGEGKAWHNDKLTSGKEALSTANLKPVVLSSKEGLTLISGTSSVTALTALSLYDAIILAKTCDVTGAMSLEVLKGTLMAMDDRLMKVRPHKHQSNSATNIRHILKGSEILDKYSNYRVQDALSLRSMPQLHGACKKVLSDCIETLNIELNSSVDNPLIFSDEDEPKAIMGCNADGAYVGISADIMSIAITNLMKMSERRIDRMLNRHLSELPAFLNNNPGLNSGLMITQYSAAGILGEMRVLSHPATIDNVSTCANQEDYVSMGYNAALKSYKCMDLAKYILAIELLCSTQAIDYYKDTKAASVSVSVYNLVREKVPFISQDANISPFIEYISSIIKNGEVVTTVESIIGKILL